MNHAQCVLPRISFFFVCARGTIQPTTISIHNIQTHKEEILVDRLKNETTSTDLLDATIRNSHHHAGRVRTASALQLDVSSLLLYI